MCHSLGIILSVFLTALETLALSSDRLDGNWMGDGRAPRCYVHRVFA